MPTTPRTSAWLLVGLLLLTLTPSVAARTTEDSGGCDGIFSCVASVVTNAAASVASAVSGAVAGVGSFFGDVGGSITGAFARAAEGATDIGGDIKDIFTPSGEALDFLKDPWGTIRSEVGKAIRAVFSILGDAIEAIFFWLGYPLRALYGAVGGVFDVIGDELRDLAVGLIGAIAKGYVSVNDSITRAVPSFGPLAPIATAAIFVGAGTALTLLGIKLVAFAKTAIGTYFTGGIVK